LFDREALEYPSKRKTKRKRIIYATFTYIPACTAIQSTIAEGDCRSSARFRKKPAIWIILHFQKKGAAPEGAAP
jgi:hypothetical protein